MNARIKTVTAIGPAHWASYLVNGDPSVFDYYNCNAADAEAEQAKADAFAAEHGCCVGAKDMEDDPMEGSQCLYTFHVLEELQPVNTITVQLAMTRRDKQLLQDHHVYKFLAAVAELAENNGLTFIAEIKKGE